MSPLKSKLRKVVFVATILAAAGIAFGETIKIAGAPILKPILSKASENFTKTKPDAHFVVGGSFSGQGLTLAGTGAVEIGMASRDLNEQDKKDYPGITATQIATDGMALVVHATNPVKQLTNKQVCDIYTGKIANWKDVGGSDTPIILYTFSGGTGKLVIFTTYFHLEPKADGKMVSFKAKDGGDFGPAVGPGHETNQDILAGIATKPNAIGFLSLGVTVATAAKGAPVKILDLDGLAATDANVQSGSYKLQNGLFLVTKGQPSGTVKEFIDYLLSAEGQKIVKDQGFVPVK